MKLALEQGAVEVVLAHDDLDEYQKSAERNRHEHVDEAAVKSGLDDKHDF